MKNKNFVSGFVSVVGRTNVGKSTLLNALLGEKLLIISDKPQTTRNNIRCIFTDDEAQIVFMDTPGIHRPKNRLGELMIDKVAQSLANTDVTLLVLENDLQIGGRDKMLLEKLAQSNKPTIAIINKADKMTQEDVLYKINLLKEYDYIDEIVPLSALTGKNVEKIIPLIKQYLQKGPMYFPEEMITDMPEKFFVEEMIREKALFFLQEEIPHGIAVEVFSMKERTGRDLMDIEATIFCERKSHKGIVIGKKGEMLKKIGIKAREDIEKFLDIKVNLQLWVKVRENWREKQYDLTDLGYQEKD
ncbi:MAG: GTPase Era [Eubacteriaceae bacterium]|jgi:GTP-binding protein Era|nr:GTPase Era [Eubacteriaceae bacterium]